MPARQPGAGAFARHPHLWWDIGLVYAPAVLVLVLHLVWVVREPLSFDEAFNLQIPLNLVLGNGYQTWYGGPHPFDVRITTGPTVLLPIVPILALFAPSAVAGRAIMPLFFAAFLITLERFSRRLAPAHHRAFFAAALACIAVLPAFFALTAAVMGEIPSITLYLLALMLAARRDASARTCALAGLCFGLSILTKLAMAMCLPVLLVTLGAGLIRRGFRVVISRLGLCTMTASAPLLLWHLWMASVLGVQHYKEYLSSMIAFIQTHGSGADRVPFATLSKTLSMHLLVLSKVFQREPMVLGVALLLLGVCATVVWLRCGRTVLRFAIVATAALITGWWLALSNWDLYRHAVPGYIFVALVCADLLIEGVLMWRPAAWWERIVLTVAAIAIFYCMPFRAGASMMNTTILPGGIGSQLDLAVLIRQIHARDAKATFWAYGWYHAPEISYLAALPFHDVTIEKPTGGAERYLVVGTHFGAPVVDDFLKRSCGTDLYRNGFYLLCRLK